MDICKSGACKGADLAWGAAAKSAGHQVIHYGFPGMNQSDEPFLALDPLELHAADPFLRIANLTLKRSFPTKSTYVDNLLRRNYYQVKDSERVYAISYIKNLMSPVVTGGTGWAVQMALDRDCLEVYVFDSNHNSWFHWQGGAWINRLKIPKPHGIYAGIGSRELSGAGLKAIESVYIE